MEDGQRWRRQIAESMDAEPELLPHLPELFQDLQDLGVRASELLTMLEPIDLPAGARVLDLGCGKGASLIQLVRGRELQGEGVDGMPDFIEHARREAEDQGVSERCRFEVGDLRDTLAGAEGLDLVMMLALGPILGDLAQTVGELRACVRPGGLIVLDDAFLEDGIDPDDEAFVDCHSHSETLAILSSHGDEVLTERRSDTSEDREWLRQATAKIMARAQGIAAREETAAELVMGFARRQQEETQLLWGPVVGATWVLRRGA